MLKIPDAPVEVAFDKDWDPNEGVRSASRRMSAEDIQRIKAEMSAEFREVFADELGKGGYSLTQAIGDRALRVTAAIADVYISAPDRMAPGCPTSYTMEAGRMTLVMELRDGPTGQLLARVIDEKSGSITGTLQMTTSASNSAEFRRAVRSRASRLVETLDRLHGKDQASSARVTRARLGWAAGVPSGRLRPSRASPRAACAPRTPSPR